MRKHNKTSKLIFTLGIFIFAFGVAFNQRLGITDSPEPYASLSIPLIVLGLIVIVVSNFFGRKQAK
ncbi:hypothetical protein MXL46_21260 [Heyndrickxia sporothermodurans]|uniref:hypothetical protein n=1 Tax=Heyndrickxia sporothermodurans TaxID=46224 RepID=UPI002DBAEB7C|nr:hypothetical protein [Heyndrickxia sporothermodurans]MEB6551515.1 hypothetical protein [Heyndrickxia sporothermodurans]